MPGGACIKGESAPAIQDLSDIKTAGKTGMRGGKCAMNRSKHRTKHISGIGRRLALLLLVFMLFFIPFSLFYDPASRVAAEAASEANNLLNGSFEEGQTWSATYKIVYQNTIPAWNTTAKDGKNRVVYGEQRLLYQEF